MVRLPALVRVGKRVDVAPAWIGAGSSWGCEGSGIRWGRSRINVVL